MSLGCGPLGAAVPGRPMKSKSLTKSGGSAPRPLSWDVMGCPRMSDDVRVYPGMSHRDVRGCPGMSGDVTQGCPGMSHRDVRGCHGCPGMSENVGECRRMSGMSWDVGECWRMSEDVGDVMGCRRMSGMSGMSEDVGDVYRDIDPGFTARKAKCPPIPMRRSSF